MFHERTVSDINGNIERSNHIHNFDCRAKYTKLTADILVVCITYVRYAFVVIKVKLT